MDKLTPNGISILIANKPCVLQIISICVGDLGSEKYNIATLSDGFTYLKIIISDDAIKKLDKPIEALQYAIITVLKSNQVTDNSKLIIIEDAGLVSAAYRTKLGNPKEYIKQNGNTPDFGEDNKEDSRDSKGQMKKSEQKNFVKRVTEIKPQEESKNNSNLKPSASNDKKQSFKQQTTVVPKNRDISVPKPAITQNQQRSTSNPQASKVSPLKKQHKSSLSYENTLNILDLSPGLEEWVIRVRVIFKSEIKKIRNKKNHDMDVVNFTFIDRQNSLVSAAAFNQMAQKYHSCIQLNFVYDVSDAQVLEELRPKSGINVMIRLILGDKCTINEAIDDNSIATIQDRCCSLSEFIEKPIGSVCSIICMVKQFEQIEEFTSKAGKLCIKRLVTICDPIERVQLKITMWGEMVHFVFENIPYLITDMTVKEFNGVKQYSSGFDCIIMPMKDHKFRRFKDLSAIEFINKSKGPNKSDRMTFEDMFLQVDTLEKPVPVWSEVKCFIDNIRTSGTMWYLSCPYQSCKKKVAEQTNSICANCKNNYEHAKYRYILNAEFSDTTSSISATMYDDIAEKLLDGRPADELHKMQIEDIKEICSLYKGKEIIALFMSKQQAYQDTIRMKHSLTKIQPFDVMKEIQITMKEVNDYLHI